MVLFKRGQDMARLDAYLKYLLEHGIGIEVPTDHPVLQCLAWWAASVFNIELQSRVMGALCPNTQSATA